MRSIILSLIILLVLFSSNAFCEEPSLAETEKKISEQRVALKEKPEDIGLSMQLGLSLVRKAEIFLKQAENSKTKKEKTENRLHARKAIEESLIVFRAGIAFLDKNFSRYSGSSRNNPEAMKKLEVLQTFYLQLKLYEASTVRLSADTYDSQVAAEKKIKNEKLREAADLFRSGYNRWRIFNVGFYFRYFEAKCLVDLNEKKQAIQILQELVLRSDHSKNAICAMAILLIQKINLKDKRYDEIITAGRSWIEFRKPDINRLSPIRPGRPARKALTEKELEEQYEKKQFTKNSAIINHNTFTAYTEILKKLNPDSDAYAEKLAEQKQHAELLIRFDNEYKTEMEKFLKAQQKK